jgi:hypothetical protein
MEAMFRIAEPVVRLHQLITARYEPDLARQLSRRRRRYPRGGRSVGASGVGGRGTSIEVRIVHNDEVEVNGLELPFGLVRAIREGWWSRLGSAASLPSFCGSGGSLRFRRRMVAVAACIWLGREVAIGSGRVGISGASLPAVEHHDIIDLAAMMLLCVPR